MSLPSEISEALRTLGVSLEGLGLENVAWSRVDALAVIAGLGGTKVAIYGGDAYASERWGMVPLEVSWTCERSVGESATDFAVRSRAEAKQFIEAHAEGQSKNVFYAFEFSSQDDAA